MSTLHIRSQNTEVLVPAGVSIYSEGTLASVRKEHIRQACISCGRDYEVPRRKAGVRVCRSCVIVAKECGSCGHNWRAERYPKDEHGRVVDYCPNCGVRYTHAKRGGIRIFSQASRRRLMRELAQLRRDKLPAFVTLTYPDSYMHHTEPAEWKRDLRAFEHRFRRQFPGGSFVWRLEVVDRKSGSRLGQLSPHYHLLVFGVNYPELRSWVPGAWFEAVGTGDEHHLRAGTRVERVNSSRGVMSYASKAMGYTMSAELGKTCQAMGVNVGRWWGIVCRDIFEAFKSVLEVFEVGEDAAVRLIRYFRRMIKAYSRDYPSLTALIDGQWFKGVLPKLAYPVECPVVYKSTGRRAEVPFWRHAYDRGWLSPEVV